MTISEHKITATVMPIASTIPAYTVDRPAAQVVYGQGANGFSAPTGCAVLPGDYGKFARGGSGQATQIENTVGSSGTYAVNNQLFNRLISGLTVGLSYTLSMWAGGYAAGGRPVRLGVSGNYGPIVTTPNNSDGTGYVEATYTFVATATSHTVTLLVDFGATASYRSLITDDFTVTRNAYTQTYPAQSIPGDPIPLSVIDATVTLDAGYQPYVRADLTCWTPTDLAKVEQIDPRVAGVRVLLHTEVSYLGTRPTVVRDFDLLLRKRSTDPDTGTMTLSLASEEALLQDKKLVSLSSERVYGLSVKTAVDYALAKIGRALAPGWTDASVVSDALPPTVTNLISNPSAEVNLTGVAVVNCTAARDTSWSKVGAASYRLYSPTAADSSMSIGGDIGTGMRNGMIAGRTYTVSGTVRLAAPLSGTGLEPRARGITVHHRAGTAAYTVLTSPQAVNVAGETRLSLTFTLPADTTDASIRFYLGATTGTVYWDALMLTEGSTVIDYFDGATADTGLIDFAWTGTAHTSSSTRTYLPNTDAMIWKPGVSASDWLEPLLNSTGLRLYADEAKVWRLLPQGSMVDGQVNVSPLTGLTRTSDDIDRDADEWYDSVVVAYRWDDLQGVAREVFDIAGAPGTKTLTVEINAPIPKFGAAQNYLNAALGKGRTYEIDAISDYLATPGKQLVLTIPNQIAVVSILRSVAFAFPQGEMTLGTRGITETPLTSWLFVPTGKRWQDVATGVTWNTYTA